MRRLYALLVIIVVAASTSSLFAQYGEAPASYGIHGSQLNPVSVINLPTFDHWELLQEDTQIEAEGGRTNHGRVIFSDLTMNNSGTWTTFQDGSKLWQLSFETENALATSVYFSAYHMPVGAKLWLTTPEQDWYVGPYDYTENNDHMRFCTEEVFGDRAILEYYQPAGVIGEPIIEMHGFGHFYRHIHDYREEWSRGGGSQPCEVDVNCPEGDGWQGPRDSVVRLTIVDGNFTGLCTGSMVNTTAEDCRQYMLSALHCADGVSEEDFGFLQVKYNYERPECGSGAFTSSHNRVGVVHLADSNDGGGNSGSDFFLVEVEDPIPASWDAFYAGWDASGTGASSGVSIHHPAGDIKKISTFTSSLVSAWWGGPGSHWQVHWVETETDHGVTEGGSSGSPIYNDDRQIVGTLTGGSSFCVAPNDPDFYGKMSYHWTNNPNPADEKLKEWLDPMDSGVTDYFGAYAPDCSQEWLDVDELEFFDFEVFPNPVTETLTINYGGDATLRTVDLYNNQGALVLTESVQSNTKRLDMSQMADGIYYLTITSDNGNQVTRKVSKVH
jgi:hypothetical protein